MKLTVQGTHKEISGIVQTPNTEQKICAWFSTKTFNSGSLMRGGWEGAGGDVAARVGRHKGKKGYNENPHS